VTPLLGNAVELENPAALWALALLVPVVLLHLYRRRRRRLEVAFLPLLRETPKEAEIVSHRLMLQAGMIRQ